jgi:imidazolonepropionase
MSAAEAWRAVTVAGARALGRAGEIGQLAPGARGDLVLWRAHDHREVPQHYGVSLVDAVVAGGKLVHRAPAG